MPTSFLRKLFHWDEWRGGIQSLRIARGEVGSQEDVNPLHSSSISRYSVAVEGSSLFAFVDLKDPFAAGEIAGEELPGPILSILSVRRFNALYLFFTPHTRTNALATTNEITRRYADCKVTAHELPVSDPKDYSSLMGGLCRQLRNLSMDYTLGVGFISPPVLEAAKTAVSRDNYVCVSSGT